MFYLLLTSYNYWIKRLFYIFYYILETQIICSVGLIVKVEPLQMASDIDASCENDPNFAVICAFLEKFGPQCGLPNLDFLELQEMLENSEEGK